MSASLDRLFENLQKCLTQLRQKNGWFWMRHFCSFENIVVGWALRNQTQKSQTKASSSAKVKEGLTLFNHESRASFQHKMIKCSFTGYPASSFRTTSKFACFLARFHQQTTFSNQWRTTHNLPLNKRLASIASRASKGKEKNKKNRTWEIRSESFNGKVKHLLFPPCSRL